MPYIFTLSANPIVSTLNAMNNPTILPMNSTATTLEKPPYCSKFLTGLPISLLSSTTYMVYS